MKRLTLIPVCLLLVAFVMPAAPSLAQDSDRNALPLQALIAGVAQRLDVRFVCEPRLLEGRTLHIADGSSGGLFDRSIPQFENEAGCWRWFASLLVTSGFGWIRMDEEQRLYRILELSELGRLAHPNVTDPSQIPDDVMWATMTIPLRHADPASVQRALLNLVTRPGGMIQPVVGRGSVARSIVVSDYRGQLPHLYDAVKRLDSEPERVVRVVTIEQASGASLLISHLQRLFQEEIKEGRVTFSADGEEGAETLQVFVRAEAQIEQEVLDAIRTIAAALGGKTTDD